MQTNSKPPDGGSGYFVRFTGDADAFYHLLRAPALTGPWGTNSSLTAPISGVVEFHDPAPLPGIGFYRTVQP